MLRRTTCSGRPGALSVARRTGQPMTFARGINADRMRCRFWLFACGIMRIITHVGVASGPPMGSHILSRRVQVPGPQERYLAVGAQLAISAGYHRERG